MLGHQGKKHGIPQTFHHILYFPGGEEEKVTDINKVMYTMLYVKAYKDTHLGQELA